MSVMQDELESQGLNCIGGILGTPEFDQPLDHITLEAADEYKLDPDVGAVV